MPADPPLFPRPRADRRITVPVVTEIVRRADAVGRDPFIDDLPPGDRRPPSGG